MSKVVNVGYVDTPIQGVTSLKLDRGLLNFKADWRIKSDTPGEMVLANLSSPVDRPERLRIAQSDVANIYQGTDIDPSVYAPSRRGTSILCQLTETFSVTDTVDADYRVDLPVSVHLVIKVPNNENLSAAMIQTTVGRLVSGIYDTGSEATTRIAAILRGSLKPSDL